MRGHVQTLQGQEITVPEFLAISMDAGSLNKLEPLKHGDH
jgi:hypothetical protein